MKKNSHTWHQVSHWNMDTHCTKSLKSFTVGPSWQKMKNRSGSLTYSRSLQVVWVGVSQCPDHIDWCKVQQAINFTEDVQIPHGYLEKSEESCFNLQEKATTQSYAQLTKVTLAQIIGFSWRHAGEVLEMCLKSFNERDSTKLHEDVAVG